MEGKQKLNKERRKGGGRQGGRESKKKGRKYRS